jgi:cell division septum initiation protein DivIVA
MSEQEGDRLSLELLAQRLEALGRENEQMRSENAELRGEVSALRDSRTHRGVIAVLRGSDRRRDKEIASEFEGRVSRGSFLARQGRLLWAPWRRGRYLVSAKPKRHQRLTSNAFMRVSKVIRK